MGRPGESGGALTSVFIETIQAHAQGQLTYLSLLDIIRSRLEEERFTQVPQLYSLVGFALPGVGEGAT